MTALETSFEYSAAKQTADTGSGIARELPNLYSNFSNLQQQNFQPGNNALLADGSIDFGQTSALYGSANASYENTLSSLPASTPADNVIPTQVSVGTADNVSSGSDLSTATGPSGNGGDASTKGDAALDKQMMRLDRSILKDFGNSSDGGQQAFDAAMALQQTMLSDPNLSSNAALDRALLSTDQQLVTGLGSSQGGEQLLTSVLQSQRQMLNGLQSAENGGSTDSGGGTGTTGGDGGGSGGGTGTTGGDGGGSGGGSTGGDGGGSAGNGTGSESAAMSIFSTLSNNANFTMGDPFGSQSESSGDLQALQQLQSASGLSDAQFEAAFNSAFAASGINAAAENAEANSVADGDGQSAMGDPLNNGFASLSNALSVVQADGSGATGTQLVTAVVNELANEDTQAWQSMWGTLPTSEAYQYVGGNGINDNPTHQGYV